MDTLHKGDNDDYDNDDNNNNNNNSKVKYTVSALTQKKIMNSSHRMYLRISCVFGLNRGIFLT
jgi:hypothetical protein